VGVAGEQMSGANQHVKLTGVKHAGLAITNLAVNQQVVTGAMIHGEVGVKIR